MIGIALKASMEATISSTIDLATADLQQQSFTRLHSRDIVPLVLVRRLGGGTLQAFYRSIVGWARVVISLLPLIRLVSLLRRRDCGTLTIDRPRSGASSADGRIRGREAKSDVA